MKVIDIMDFCIPEEFASYEELSTFADEIAELATYPIEAEPVRHGRWLYDKENGATGIYLFCSCCRELIYQTGDFNYCPNCGAKMDGGEE